MAVEEISSYRKAYEALHAGRWCQLLSIAMWDLLIRSCWIYREIQRDPKLTRECAASHVPAVGWGETAEGKSAGD